MPDQVLLPQIPGYRIERELGHGGMAVVYLAIQESLDRPVALKVLSRRLIEDELLSARFLKEAHIVAKLTHPNIITIFDIGRHDHQHFISMEYISGGSLKERIQKGIDRHQALLILRQIAEGVGYAHRRGFLHRDIKPQNILFRDDDTAVLTDFGIAKAVSGDATLAAIPGTLFAGSPAYMSPEQVKGLKLDGRSDLYGLGIVLYEMLTGVPPYQAEAPLAVAFKHVHEPAPRLRPDLSALQPVLDKLLAKEPEERYENAEQLVAALDALDLSLNHPQQATVHHDNHPPKISNAISLWRTGGLAAAALLLAGVLGYVIFQTPSPPAGIPSEPEANAPTAPPPTQVTPEVAQATVAAPPPEADAQPSVATEVQRLLDQAVHQRHAQRLTTPAGDNAFETYSQVLALDPANINAREGIALIAEEYLQQAKRLRDAKRPQESLAQVQAGLRVMPTHRALSSLGQTLQSELAAIAQVKAEQEAQHKRIAELESRAERQWQTAHLTEPPGNNAYQSYRDILTLDANNTQAKAGIERLATHFVNTARAHQRDGDLAASLRATNDGLLVMPDHAELLNLRTQVQAQMTAHQHTQEENQSPLSPPASPIPVTPETPAPTPPQEERKKPRVFGTF